MIVRGWREVAPKTWQSPRPEDREEVCDPSVALWQCRRDDLADAREHGSVTYRPTAEQVELLRRVAPDLAQRIADGLTERDMIGALCRELRAAYTYDRGDLL